MSSTVGTIRIRISTLENSVADMEIIFPRPRFVILSDMSRLPDILPRRYTRLAL